MNHIKTTHSSLSLLLFFCFTCHAAEYTKSTNKLKEQKNNIMPRPVLITKSLPIPIPKHTVPKNKETQRLNSATKRMKKRIEKNFEEHSK